MKLDTLTLTRRCAVACLLGTALSGVQAQTTAWPDKPVKIIVPFAPGGGTDQVARMVAVEIAKDLGQPVIVENKPGAAGNLGADFVAKSAPDGYTLLWGTVGTQAINQLVSKKLPYDAQRDFKPVSMVATYPNLLVVPVSSPPKAWRTWWRWARPGASAMRPRAWARRCTCPAPCWPCRPG